MTDATVDREQFYRKVDAQIASLVAESGKLNAETAKLNAEASKLRTENRYYLIVVTATFTLAIVAVAKLFL